MQLKFSLIEWEGMVGGMRMNEKIRKITEIINKNNYGWYRLRPDFEKILGEASATEMIEEFEGEFETYPSKKLPHYCLIFYIALLTLVEKSELKDLSRIVAKKKSYKLMQRGMKIFLSGKSQNLNYKAELSEAKYHNKYEYVCFLIDYLSTYQIQLQGYINILELVYEVDKDEALDILSTDKNYVIALCFLIDYRNSYEYEDLLPLLESEDKIKSNAAFYLLMEDFNNYVESDKYKQTEEISNKLDQEIKSISNVIGKLSAEKKVHLIINYLFSEDSYPVFFVEILQQVDRELVVAEVKAKDFRNLSKLVSLGELLIRLDWKEFKDLFVSMFLSWVENEANPYTWLKLKESIQRIFHSLSIDYKIKLIDGLTDLKSRLYITSFDQQVRYPLFLEDEKKATIIADFLNEEWE